MHTAEKQLYNYIQDIVKIHPKGMGTMWPCELLQSFQRSNANGLRVYGKMRSKILQKTCKKMCEQKKKKYLHKHMYTEPYLHHSVA
jgi:hypothetical protein